MANTLKSFYNFAKILSFNAIFIYIVSIRGVGKSYGAKKYAISKALRNGQEFIYLRRYKTELDKAAPFFFDDVSKEFPRWDFRVEHGHYEAARRISRKQGESDEEFRKRQKSRKWKLVGHYYALTEAQKVRSTAFPLVTTILFDEFIIEKGMGQYLPNEYDALFGFFVTVDRGQDKTKVIFLANSVSINNPYFLREGIEPDKADENGFIVKDKDAKGQPFTVVHFAKGSEFAGEMYQTRLGQKIKGTDYAKYAAENEFADNHDYLLEDKPSNADYVFTLETKRGLFSMWTLDNDKYWIQAGTIRANENIFTMLPEKVRDGAILMRRNHKGLVILRNAFDNHRTYFDSKQTRNIFVDIFDK